MTSLRFLVPVDPTHPTMPAAQMAVALATKATTVELVAVTTSGLPAEVVDAFLDEERSRFPDARVEVRRLEGPAVVDALLDHIAHAEPDLVVLDSHGRGPLGELVLGSVSADLVRSSAAPTLLVGPACEPVGELRRLTVAVDGSPDALGALDVAARLSRRFDVPIELVEVADEMAYTSDVAESAELHRLAARVDPPVRSWDVLHGHDVPRALIDHVRYEPGVVLVLGSHGRSPGRPNVLGGTAARTVRHSTVPVLVVSPQAAAGDEGRHLAESSLP
jgi:nucleotide-binding universal stress UspA family protein